MSGHLHGLRAVFLREFHGYFATPLAYVFIVIFLFTTGAFAFYIGNFFESAAPILAFSFRFIPGSIFSLCLPSPCGSGRKNKRPERWKF